MSPRNAYWLAYPAPFRSDRDEFPPVLRDAEAANYIISWLTERGYRYQEPIINVASPGPGLVDFDCSVFGESDIIFVVTRTPMNDFEVGARKRISRSFTTLEDQLFRGSVRPWIEYCTRTEAILSEAATTVSDAIAARRSMEFVQNGGARYKEYGSFAPESWRRFKDPHPLTAAFLVYAEHAWPGGPAFLAAFAMRRIDTLVWCRALTKRFPQLLCSTPFALAELHTQPWPKHSTDMSFADTWTIEILGAASSPVPPRAPSIGGLRGGNDAPAPIA